MSDIGKQAQVYARQIRISTLRHEARVLKQQKKHIAKQINDISDQIEKEQDAIDCIQNDLPVQTILTSDDEKE